MWRRRCAVECSSRTSTRHFTGGAQETRRESNWTSRCRNDTTLIQVSRVELLGISPVRGVFIREMCGRCSLIVWTTRCFSTDAKHSPSALTTQMRSTSALAFARTTRTRSECGVQSAAFSVQTSDAGPTSCLRACGICGCVRVDGDEQHSQRRPRGRDSHIRTEPPALQE